MRILQSTIFFILISSFVNAESYVSKIGDLFFVAERANNNFKFWDTYLRVAKEAHTNLSQVLYMAVDAIENKNFNEKFINENAKYKKFLVNQTDEEIMKERSMVNGIADGLENFGRSLQNINSVAQASDVWVIYVTSDSLLEAPKSKILKIEMAMAVLVNEGSPIVMHMGIARNPLHLINEDVQHSNISAKFHAFAAKVILSVYKRAKYLVTTPLSSMANILRRELKPGSFAEGMNVPGTWIELAVKNNYPISAMDNGFKFTLYDRDISDKDNRELIVEINDANKEKYGWLVYRLHDPKQFPYFAAKLANLASLFEPVLTLIPDESSPTRPAYTQDKKTRE